MRTQEPRKAGTQAVVEGGWGRVWGTGQKHPAECVEKGHAQVHTEAKALRLPQCSS